MCERYKAQFSAVHLVTALHRVAKAEDAQSAIGDDSLTTLTADVSELFVAPGDNESTRHLSNTAWALAVLLLKNRPLLDSISSQSLNRIQQLDP